MLALLVVHLVAVDEQDEVRILLDRAGFTEIRHHRALVLALLQAPVELRARHHRHHQLLGERLQRAGDLGDLRRAVLARARNVHELEVVDHDETEPVLALEPAAAGAQLGRGQGGVVDDEDAGVVEQPELGGQTRPVLGVQPSGADLLLIDPAERREHPHDELLGRHLHAEHHDGLPGPYRRLLDEVHRERGLSHRRASRDDDQIAPLQTGRLPVEVRESGRQSGDRVVPPVQLVDVPHHAGEHVLDGHRLLPAGAASLGDLEDAALGVVQKLVRRLPLRPVRRLRDLVAGPDQLAKHRALADDLRVRDDVRGAGGVPGELGEVGEAAHGFELAIPVEPLRHGDGIARPPFVAQARDRVEHGTMVVAVEVLAGQDVGDPIPRAVVDENAAQDRLFGLDRVRREAKRGGAGCRRVIDGH